MSSPRAKQNRTLPHRNRKHVLRAISQPKSQATPAKVTLPVDLPTTSASKPVTISAPRPFRFLDLPGEIRNRIYDLVIPQSRVIISGSHPQKELQKLKQLEPLKKHKLPRYHLNGVFSHNSTDVSLLFTCHQLNQEVIQYVYARTTFCFDRFFVLRKFLNLIPEAARTGIQSLEITHVGYSEPILMADRKWKLRHDAKWANLLQQVKCQTSLRRLVLDMTFFDWPIQLDLTEEWAQPLLKLAGDGLDRVDLKLEQDRFALVRVAAVAKELENRMMTAAGRRNKRLEQKRKEAEEKKRKEASKRKATKSLKVNLPNGTPKASGAAKKVVKSTGLQQYAIAQPQIAFC